MKVYFGNYLGKSKDKGNEYQRVSILEIKKHSTTGELMGRMSDFFLGISDKIDCSGLVCGDIVECEMVENRYNFDGKPELVGIKKVGENIFANFVK